MADVKGDLSGISHSGTLTSKLQERIKLLELGELTFEAMAKSAARSIGSSLGRQILRGALGSILGGRR